MLLTLTTTHRPATDLGHLQHKHPDRVQSFGLPFGRANVFYPEAADERCTAALLLEIDPVGLVRRGGGRSAFALAEYVNDRPYVASSLLSVAMNAIYKSAMAGTCVARPELAQPPIPLEARLPAVPARGGEPLVRRVFEPLGYELAVRGRKYLRIIYGPEYCDPGQIDRLRSRGLARKRGLAAREFGLGVEALERFVRREPLYRVHECAFAVLALESDPVDPRL